MPSTAAQTPPVIGPKRHADSGLPACALRSRRANCNSNRRNSPYSESAEQAATDSGERSGHALCRSNLSRLRTAGRPHFLPPEPGTEEGSFQADMQKRSYQSLFASNVAVSYRKEMLAGANLHPPRPATVDSRPDRLIPFQRKRRWVSHCQRKWRSFHS